VRETELVLLKSRRQRCCEALILLMLFLMIGPILRAVLGDYYEGGSVGLVAWYVVSLLAAKLGALVAPWFGGEWVSRAERSARFLAEEHATPLWRLVVLRALGFAAFSLGFLLLLASLDQLIDTSAGRNFSIVIIVMCTILGGIFGLFGRRILARPPAVPETPLSRKVPAWTFRILVRLYASCAGGTAVAVLATRYFVDHQILAFVAATRVVSPILFGVVLLDIPVRGLFAGHSRSSFGRRLWIYVLFLGVPAAIILSGIPAVEAPSLLSTVGSLMVAEFMAALCAIMIWYALLRALQYLTIRASDAPRVNTAAATTPAAPPAPSSPAAPVFRR
jgi:hypothetical protein